MPPKKNKKEIEPVISDDSSDESELSQDDDLLDAVEKTELNEDDDEVLSESADDSDAYSNDDEDDIASGSDNEEDEDGEERKKTVRKKKDKRKKKDTGADCPYKNDDDLDLDEDEDDVCQTEEVIDDNNNECDKEVDKEDYISRDKLTKYERTLALAIRARQIEEGSQPMVENIEGLKLQEIAWKELREKKCPLLVKREMLDGGIEYRDINDLIIIN